MIAAVMIAANRKYEKIKILGSDEDSNNDTHSMMLMIKITTVGIRFNSHFPINVV